MQPVDVCYENNKTGTYVQFRLEVFTNDLQELMAYSNFLMKGFQRDFAVLFKTYDMAFTNASCYLLPSKKGMYLINCILGDTTPQLEDTLKRLGIERRGFDK